MYKIKLQKTSKCLWPVDIDMLVVKWMLFFDVFINHFQKIPRSVLHKITIDLWYFWNVCDVNLWGKLAFRRFHKTLSENPYKCSPQNNNRSMIFLSCLWRQSMRKVSYHSKTLLHRNQAQERLWFARLLFKNNKRNDNRFNNRSCSLFFLVNMF